MRKSISAREGFPGRLFNCLLKFNNIILKFQENGWDLNLLVIILKLSPAHVRTVHIFNTRPCVFFLPKRSYADKSIFIVFKSNLKNSIKLFLFYLLLFIE